MAVLAELLDSGIDRFSIERVATRADVDAAVIRLQWHDRRVLLMDAMLARTSASAWNPDTGSLHTDLEAMSSLAVELSQTAAGRALFRRVLPGGSDVDLAEISSDLWAARFRDAAQVLQRAVERAQLRDGIAPEEAIRMFAAAFYYDVIFNDSPVRPEYADHVVDIFLHGILGAAGRDRPWGDIERLLGASASGDGGSAADQALETARRAVVLMRVWADALLDPVVLYEAVRDDHGQVVDFLCRDLNRAVCDEVGLTRSDLVGRTLLDMLPLFAQTGLLERYTECLVSTQPLVLNDFRYMHYDRERYLDIRTTNAGTDLITVTWRDVTDRHESAQRDERYRKLMDFSPIPVGVTTADGRFVSVNQAMATMVGYGIETLLTMRWQDLTAPDLLPREVEMVAEMLAGPRETYRTVKQYRHADGHLFDAELLLSCIRNDSGEVENLIAQIIPSGR
jgi:PAS domain S-box-containing protein